MQRRVHAHAGVSLVPINLGGDAVADLWHGSADRQHVRDLGLGGIGINGGFDRNARAVRKCERTGVTRLPARRRIKNCAVEHDAALFGHGDNTSLAAFEV